MALNWLKGLMDSFGTDKQRFVVGNGDNLYRQDPATGRVRHYTIREDPEYSSFVLATQMIRY